VIVPYAPSPFLTAARLSSRHVEPSPASRHCRREPASAPRLAARSSWRSRRAIGILLLAGSA
jgi:hypothetical protein